MEAATVLTFPAETPGLTVAPEPDAEAKAWNFGEVPVQGELFPRDYAA
jgi:hypothetical protein